MVIPGYDPDDLEETLRVMVEREGADQYLTEAEQDRWKGGEELLDLLDEGDIERLVREAPEDLQGG